MKLLDSSKEYSKTEAIEHSENTSIRQSGPFENEIGPGVLQSGVQQAWILEEYERLEA